MIRCWLLLFATALHSAGVWAASTAVSSAPRASHSVVGARTEGFDFVALGQLLIGLIVVLLLFFAMAWLVKRSGVAGGFAQGDLKVVATLPLSTRERAVLIQAGSRQLLLGVAPGRVTLLESFDQPLVEPDEKTSPPFSKWLQQAIHKQRTVDSEKPINKEAGHD